MEHRWLKFTGSASKQPLWLRLDEIKGILPGEELRCDHTAIRLDGGPIFVLESVEDCMALLIRAASDLVDDDSAPQLQCAGCGCRPGEVHRDGCQYIGAGK